ncbi:MAG: hypothetical protein IKU83_03565 [Lachnospiraceae bacterium]|nr:hypothetical protein [Lachnospiraceae bacterium]
MTRYYRNFKQYNFDCDTYQAGDSCYGEVTSRCATGIFLRLDDGQSAFSNTMLNVDIGEKVLCTILALAKEGKRTFVSADSVVYA